MAFMHSVIIVALAIQIHLMAVRCDRKIESSFCCVPRKGRVGIFLINTFYINASQIYSFKDCPVFKKEKGSHRITHNIRVAQVFLTYFYLIPNLPWRVANIKFIL